MFEVQRVRNRDDFIDYCMRALGAPVIQINIDESQVQDRVNDALKMFYDYHVDGSEKVMIAHSLTADDIKNKYITVPNNVLVITGIVKGDMGYNINNNLQIKAYFSDLISNSFSSGSSSYVLTKSYLNTFNNIFGNNFKLIEHNYYKNKLSGIFEWDKFKSNDVIVYEAWVANNIDEVFGDYWLQQYATALIKKQWGNNLIKVDGMTLPGGGRLNGGAILSRALQEINDLEDRLRDEFALPIMPRMG